MRRFVLGLEGRGASGFNGKVLSYEEYAVVQAEAQQDLNDINSTEGEIERAMDTADSLEDLAAVVDTVDEATPTEVALVQVAGDMAVAGTDAISEDVVPVTEAYIGRRIATEGIVEQIKQLWASIKKFVKDMWAKVTTWFNKVFGTLPTLRRQLDDLRKRLDVVQSGGYRLEGDAKKFPLTNVEAVTVDMTPIKDGKGFIKALDTTGNADIITTVKGMTKLLEDLADDLGKSDFDNYDNMTAASRTISAKLFGIANRIINNTGLNGPKVDGNINKYNKFIFLGNKGVSLHLKKVDELMFKYDGVKQLNFHRENRNYVKELREDINVLKSFKECAELVRILEAYLKSNGDYLYRIIYFDYLHKIITLATSIKLRFATPDTKKKLPDEIQFSTLSTSEIETLLDKCDDLLDDLESYEKSNVKRDLDKATINYNKFCDQVEKDAKSWDKDDDPNDKADQANFNKMARVVYRSNSSFTSICTFLTTGVISQVTSDIKTAMMLCSKSLSLYTKS